MVRLDNQIAIKGCDRYSFDQDKNEKHIPLTQGMLTNLVIESIQVSKESSLEDITSFKKDYRDELGLFRTRLQN